MNVPALLSWSPQRWIWTIGLVFVVQVLLVWYWLDRSPLSIRSALARPSFNLSSPQLVDPEWQVFLQLADPSLFARASQPGFSGAAWLNSVLIAPPGWNWVETNQWLGLQARDLPDTRSYWTQLQPIWNSVAEKPAPYYTEYGIPSERVETHSFTQIEGDLKSRPLLTAERLPSWAHPELLRETSLQVVVGSAGGIVSARLDASSGLEAADQWALNWAKNARFQPLDQTSQGVYPVWEPVTSGRVVFHWGATHLPVTNQPLGKG